MMCQTIAFRSGVVICLMMMVLCCMDEPAIGRTWTVRQDGSGDFSTIQPAVNASAPGDTVLIGAGRYTEHAPFDFGALTEETYVVVDTPNVTIRGENRDNVTIGPETYSQITPYEPNGIHSTAQGSGLRVESVTIENIPEGLGVLGGADVRDCVFRNCLTGTAVFGAAGAQVEDSIYKDCEQSIVFSGAQGTGAVRRCTFQAYGSPSPGMVMFSGATNARIEDCEFVGDAFTQFQSQTTGIIRRCVFTGGGGINVQSQSSIELEANYIGVTPRIALFVSSSHVTGVGNVIEGGADSGILMFSKSTAVLHNNHILFGGGWSVRALHYDTADYQIDLTDNYWGTADSSQISAWIRDGNDPTDPGEPIVQFSPFADGPVPSESNSMGAVKARFAPEN